MSLHSLQVVLARLLTDAQFRQAALAGEEALPDELRGLDAGRVEAFARSLAAKRMKALRRALPLAMRVIGGRATDWLECYVAADVPTSDQRRTTNDEGAAPSLDDSCFRRWSFVVGRSSSSDPERFAAFATGEVRKEAGLPGWLADLLVYEAARYAVERAPIPVRRVELSAAPVGAAHVALGPAVRVLALDWNIPALLPDLRRGDLPDVSPEPVRLLLARTPERGDVRERAINRATWDLLRRCDGAVTVDAAIAAVAGELGLRPVDVPTFSDECRSMLAALLDAGVMEVVGWYSG